ncbi:heavy metal transport/detoxification protein [Flavihumibacter sp. RY-1]|uniref:Heavy metal transport/detoxification protein n=1 Tax=Flavihumibacter fluminis TaxID=2909236 RepID=A0ABS9BI10_9BACT|nr:heavy metal transport/detoxification protein [Flavihumibacter fluminis]MCF1715362.1 heavy metal transport/detoxification protein [Flavihumibacter fluminis]
METLQFKTTIKCSGCIEKVTPYLNETVGENNWEVDLQNPQKVLTIPNAEQVQTGEVVEALAKAGYKAEKI